MSYFEEIAEAVSVVSGADFSSDAAIPGSNRLVVLGASGATLAGANALAYGVMTTNQPLGAAGRVVVSGVVPVVVGAGGVTVGVPAGAGANGVLVAGATTKLGVPLATATEGQIVPFKLALVANAAA